MDTSAVRPSDLVGPRSFFTDLDPRDADFAPSDVIRKLKLQLLTKEHVVIAASSLYHKDSYDLFQYSPGLDTFLLDGVILPAIHDKLSGPTEFFQVKKHYPKKCADYFSSVTSNFLSWSLKENTKWFTGKILDSINDDCSLLRSQLDLSEGSAQQFGFELEQAIDLSPDKGFLTRPKIIDAAQQLSTPQQAVVRSYTDLVYKISGTRVVNCEGHFPQANLTRFQLAGNEAFVSDDSIFWDIFVEAVVSYLNSAIRVTPERLDQLTFGDVHSIRKRLVLKDFTHVYDDLIDKAKMRIDIRDPDRVLLRQEEIMKAAESLHNEFADRVQAEIGEEDSTTRQGRLWEVVNVLAMIANPAVGFVVSCLSALKALPEITALCSPKLAESLNDRQLWLEKYVNGNLGWTQKNKRALIEGYKHFAQHGLDP